MRIANIYGPGCHPEHNSVIATFCYKSANGEPLRIDGDGRQERDFIYIEDVTRAMVLAGMETRAAAVVLRALRVLRVPGRMSSQLPFPRVEPSSRMEPARDRLFPPSVTVAAEIFSRGGKAP